MIKSPRNPGCEGSEPGLAHRHVEAARALQRHFEELPAGTMVDAHAVSAMLALIFAE